MSISTEEKHYKQTIIYNIIMEQATFFKINPADSVVVCLSAKKQGDIIEVDGKQIRVNQDTPAGHKVMIVDVKQGEDIIKYGYPIGHAREDLKAGDWVNENNLKTNLSGTLEYTYNPVGLDYERSTYNVQRSTFKGFVRRLTKKVSMPYGRGTTTMVVHSSLRTTRTPARYFVTFVCTQMQVVCWY